jgi:hypothetical protein
MLLYFNVWPSGKDFGSYALVNLSHPTVCNWEIHLAATLCASAVHFHRTYCGRFMDEEPRDCISLFVFSTDAANTGIWQQAKLHGLILTTVVWDSGSRRHDIVSSPIASCTRHCFANLNRR